MKICERADIRGIQYIEIFCSGKRYVAAKILINISPTLYGIKPGTLLSFSSRKDKDLIKLWDIHKQDIIFDPNIHFIELKRDPNNLVVLFYHRRYLSRQIFAGKHLRFLERFGYNQHMSLDDMLEHLKRRYHISCPHEIGLFLGIPLKDVLGYLKLIPLECSYCGYWKVYGNPEKSQRLFQRYRTARHQVIQLICSGEDPVNLLKKPLRLKCNRLEQYSSIEQEKWIRVG